MNYRNLKVYKMPDYKHYIFQVDSIVYFSIVANVNHARK